jgi:hypothetical protein
MLNYKLKIVFWKDVFHPILVTFLSIVQNITALFKIWLKKRYNALSGRIIRIQDFWMLLPRIDEFSRQKNPKNQEISTSSNGLSLKNPQQDQQMNKLYQDDFLYDKKVLLNGKHKL